MKSDVDAVIGTMKMLTYRQYDYGHTGDKAGFLKSQIFKTDLKVKKSSVAYDNYDKVGNLLKYHLSVNDKKNAKGFTSTHRLEYEKAQGYQQTVDRAETKFNNGQSSSGVSLRYYDVNGNLQEARDVNGENSISYLNDSREGLKERREKDSVTGYLNVGGHVIADIKINKATNEQTLDVYGGFTPQGSAQKSENPYKEGTIGHALHSAIQWQQYSLIAGANINDFLSAKEYYENAGKDATGAPTNLASDNLGSYTVKGGDTLQSIALEVYGDASLWYLIADANGITDSQTRAGSVPGPVSPDDISKGKTNRTNSLQPGTQITIPPAANGQHHTNATHKVYNPQAMLGDTSATTPVPPPPPPPPQGKHHKCSMKNIIVGVVAVIATVATAGVIGMAMGAVQAGTGLLAAGSAVLGGTAVFGASATTALLGTMAAGFTAGFVGALASQGAAMAMGMQKDINIKSALASGLATAATGGLLQYTGGGELLKGLDKLQINEYFKPSSAAQMMLQDSSSQALNLAMNKHQHFKWDELAGAGIAGGILGGKAGKAMDAGLNKIDKAGILKSEAHAVAGAASNSAVGGSHFDAMQVLTDNLGSSLGNGVVDSLNQTPLPKYDPAQLLEGDIYSQYFPTDQEAYDYAVATNQYAPIPAEGAYAEYRNTPEPELESYIAPIPKGSPQVDNTLGLNTNGGSVPGIEYAMDDGYYGMCAIPELGNGIDYYDELPFNNNHAGSEELKAKPSFFQKAKAFATGFAHEIYEHPFLFALDLSPVGWLDSAQGVFSGYSLVHGEKTNRGLAALGALPLVGVGMKFMKGASRVASKSSATTGRLKEYIESTSKLDYSPISNVAEKEFGYINKPTLTPAQQASVNKVDRLLRDHAKPHDFSGVAKELSGQKIAKSSGGYFDHVQEMLDTVRGLDKQMIKLEGMLRNPRLLPENRAVLENTWHRSNEALRQMHNVTDVEKYMYRP